MQQRSPTLPSNEICHLDHCCHWYTFTPSADATLTADTSQSSYLAVVCVYTGSRGALSKVADGLQQATFQATAGVTYHFMVADYVDFGGGGNLVFQLQ